MTVQSAAVTFHLPAAQSLKDKRQVARSLIDRARRRFNASVAEVDTQDMIRTLTLGVAVVSGSADHALTSLQAVLRYMEEEAEAELVSVEML